MLYIVGQFTGKGWAPSVQHTNLYFNQFATAAPEEETHDATTGTYTQSIPEAVQVTPTKDANFLLVSYNLQISFITDNHKFTLQYINYIYKSKTIFILNNEYA